MHIIIYHLYSFISVTATQTEYNSVLYQIIKVVSADWTKQFFHHFRVLGQTVFWKLSGDFFENMFQVLFLQLLLAWLKVKSLP